MRLDEYLVSVAWGYDRRDGFNTPQQILLRRAPEELGSYAPPDFMIRASGGQRPLQPTSTPWIGFFDPDESTSPMQGLYVVWILQATGDAWTLSLLMGTENRAKQIRAQDGAARLSNREAHVLALLRAEVSAIRREMPSGITNDWESEPNLRSRGTRQRRYEAATILSRTYSLSKLPDDAALHQDLTRLCVALQEAVHVKRGLAVTSPGLISTTSASVAHSTTRDLVFEPGTDRTTTVVLKRSSITRSPRHEGGLDRYGKWLKSRGLDVATNVHPRDFIILGWPSWLGEYKVVYGRDVARATREAHSQLKEYRHFIYSAEINKPGLLAVFSDPITDQRVAWLNAEGIAVVWAQDGTWRGCPFARTANLGV